MDNQVAIFGDVHGEFEMLVKLISEVRRQFPNIEIYSLGDLIDRGPSSRDVIDFCINEDIHVINSNHDSWLQTLVVQNSFDDFCLKNIMGGKATFKSFGIDVNMRKSKDLAMELLSKLSLEQKKWISNIPNYRCLEIEGTKYWLFHAGLVNSVAEQIIQSNGIKLSDHEIVQRVIDSDFGLSSILWTTPNFGNETSKDNLYHFKNGVQIVGHQPVKFPIIKEHFIAMDTGCGTCEPFTLSAIILPFKKIIQLSKY